MKKGKEMNIIIDTREKKPWTFAKGSAETTFRKLDTGDYAIDGLEDVLCIERKQSASEIANNITDSRFERELKRMSEFKYKYLILEFDLRHIDDFPEGSGIPKHLKNKVRVKGPFIIKRLTELSLKYDIHVLYCSNVAYAEHIAYSIMKEVYDKES